MLALKDFYHLPQVDSLVAQIVRGRAGLVVVAGLDPRPGAGYGDGVGETFLPSGRSTIFGILAREMLEAHPAAPASLVSTQRDAIRLPRALKARVRLPPLKNVPPLSVQLAESIDRGSEIILLDGLDLETVEPALTAGRAGARVVAQLDSVFRGSAVARHLLDLGAGIDSLAGLAWAVTVLRLPTLCPHCREGATLDPAREVELRRLYPDWPPGGTVFRAAGCVHCGGSGRRGDVAAFDFFQVDAPPPALFEQPSTLSLEEYVLRLALAGQVPIDDLPRLEAGQLHRTYRLLSASERALHETNRQLARKLAELQAANRVLEQRTESLVSLQEIAETLISSTQLHDLAQRITRHVVDVCRADRSILYVMRPDATAEVLAVNGWDPAFVGARLDALEVFGPAGQGRPPSEAPSAARATAAAAAFDGWPPGIPYRHPDLEGAVLRAGLRIPLISQNEIVGLMIVHSTRRPRFMPGEVALLQTFANQAAVAMQRAGLIDSLRDKIARLEAAQAQIVQKERLERELELARQVQQSLLPSVFPVLPGFRFAARNATARQVGGDFYDLFRVDEGHFGVVIADVSDKGMPAALYMTLTRSLLLAEARRELSPRAVLAGVHRLLLELGDPNMFVTVFYGVVDRTACTLTYARAGHERPILLRDGASTQLTGKGLFLGLLDLGELPLSEECLQLAAGDRLVFYTDGLADTLGADGSPFGLEHLEAFLRRQAGSDPAELCTATFDELAAYRGATDQYDDMAMLVLQVD